jgi:hypothetical protein
MAVAALEAEMRCRVVTREGDSPEVSPRDVLREGEVLVVDVPAEEVGGLRARLGSARA